jgi:hypothetical protein
MSESATNVEIVFAKNSGIVVAVAYNRYEISKYA